VDSSGTVHEWEGGFPADNDGVAISTAKQMSITWNAKEIYYISLYIFDPETGEICPEPVMWQSYGKDNTPLEPRQLLLEDKTSYTYEPQVRTVVAKYAAADWAEATDLPTTFVTLKLKEQ
jgi:hypothetical protein